MFHISQNCQMKSLKAINNSYYRHSIMNHLFGTYFMQIDRNVTFSKQSEVRIRIILCLLSQYMRTKTSQMRFLECGKTSLKSDERWLLLALVMFHPSEVAEHIS